MIINALALMRIKKKVRGMANKKEILEGKEAEVYLEKDRGQFGEKLMNDWDTTCYLASKIKLGKANIVRDKRGFSYTKIK